MFAGAVVADFVGADELVADRDLDAIADDGDPHLATSVLDADSLAGAGEADVAARVDLAGAAVMAAGMAGGCKGDDLVACR